MPSPTNDEIESQLGEIFSRPEFGGGEQPVNWLERILRWLGQWLGSLEGSAPLLYWLIIGVCVTLLLLLAVYVALSVRRMLFVSSRSSAQAKSAELRRGLSMAHWEEALRRAAAGDFTEAIRYLFLSLVYRFDEKGRVNFRRAYTNREYLTLFADRPPLYTDLKVFVDLLDDHWYGERSSTPQQYEQCQTHYQTLVSQA